LNQHRETHYFLHLAASRSSKRINGKGATFRGKRNLRHPEGKAIWNSFTCAMNFTSILSAGRAPGGGQLSQVEQEQQMINYVRLNHTNHPPSLANNPTQWKGISESCPFKMVLAGGMGFAMGGAFGLFMSSVRLSLSHSPYRIKHFKKLTSVLSPS
jgi:hypothetical protein